MRYWWFVLIAVQLVGLAAITWDGLSGADGLPQAASPGTSNPFVLTDVGGRTLASRVVRLTVEIQVVRCVESCRSVFVIVSDRGDPRHEHV